MVCAGGYPATLSLTVAQRRRWYRDYLRTVVQRDIVDLADIRRADAVAPVLATVAALSGQELNVARLARGAGVDSRTADSYLAWLATVFLVHRVPMWSRNPPAVVHDRNGPIHKPAGWDGADGRACATARS